MMMMRTPFMRPSLVGLVGVLVVFAALPLNRRPGWELY
jgi:hypothetical protein